ncbi:MAG: MerR family transcriptional regulator, partial [Myxococcota bacterium]
MSQNLSTAEASRILGMKEARIREMVRAGLCRPARSGHRYVFSFQDLVVLRAAQGLLDRRVPAARVRRALATLLAQLPPGRSLSGLRIYADGRDVAVCDGDTSWQPSTGQTVLNFEVDPLTQAAQDLREARQRHHPQGSTARAEFERALDLEDEDPKAACEAYGRALARDPELVDAYVNLGRIAHEAGDAREAVRLYEMALERTPGDPVVH